MPENIFSKEFTSETPATDTALATRKENDVTGSLKAVVFSPVGVPVAAGAGVADSLFGTDLRKSAGDAFGSIYRDNESAYNTVADIATMFGVLGAVGKGTRIIGNAKKGTSLGNLSKFGVESGKQQALQRLIRKTQTGAIRKGVPVTSGIERLNRYKKVSRQVGLKNLAVDTVASEAALYATHNNSDLFYPEGMGFADFALSVAIPAGGLFAYSEMRAASALRKAASQAGEEATKFEARIGSTPDKEIIRPQARDASILQNINVANNLDKLVDVNTPELNPTYAKRSQVARSFAKTQIEKAAQDNPITGISKTKVLEPAEIDNLQSAIGENNSAFFGLSSFEPMEVYTGWNKTVTKRRERLKLELENPDLQIKAKQELAKLDQSSIHLVDNAGEIVPYSTRTPSIYDTGATITKSNKTDTYGITGSSPLLTNDDKALSFTSRGKPLVNGNAIDKLDTLTPFQMSIYQAQAKKAVDEWKPPVVHLPEIEQELRTPIATHLQADYALAVANKHGDDNLKYFSLPDGIADKQQLELFSIKQKYNEFLARRVDEKMTPHDLGRTLNINFMSKNGDTTPLFNFFDKLADEKDPQKIMNNIDSLETFKGLLNVSDNPERLPNGDTLSSMVLDNGMLAYQVKSKPIPFVRTNSIGDIGIEAISKLEDLQNIRYQEAMKAFDNAPQIFTKVSGLPPEQSLVGNVRFLLDRLAPVVEEAKKVTELSEAVLRNKFVSGITMRDFRMTDSIPMLAASDIERAYSKMTNEYLRVEMMPLKVIAEQFKNPANKADLLEVNTFINAQQMGWDFANDSIDNLTLAKTSNNAELWKHLFDDIMPDDAVLPNPVYARRKEYKPLVLGEKAKNFFGNYMAINRKRLADTNAIQSITQSKMTPKRNMHISAINLAEGETVWLMDSSQKVIGYVNKKTLASARQSANKIAEEAATRGEILVPIEQSNLEAYAHINDKAFRSRLANFSDGAVQTGSKQIMPIITDIAADYSQIERLLTSLADNARAISKRTVYTVFEPQFNYMGKMSQVVGSAKDDFNVYQLAEQQLLGTQHLPRESIWRKLDDVVVDVYANIRGATKGVSNLLPKFRIGKKFSGISVNPNSPSEMTQALRELIARNGTEAPIDSTLELFQSAYREVAIPADLKKDLTKLNNLTASVMLRYGELGHPLINLASMPIILPTTVAWLQRGTKEGVAAWRKRIGTFGIYLRDDVAMPSPTRVLMEGTRTMFKPEGKQIIAEARSFGYVNQNAAEGLEELNEGRVLRALSYLTDKSESFSREMAYVSGFRLAEQAGKFTDRQLLHSFANNFADKVIGDYRPNNKADLYRGAIGTPFGLFKTFMTNYYQKLWQSIENNNARSLLIGLGTQASIFGIASVPGYDVVDGVLPNGDNERSLLDVVQSTFDNDVLGELVINGSLAEIPRLFGADTGIALFTRGDVNPRNPAEMFNVYSTPVGIAATQLTQGLLATVDVMSQQGFSTRAITETMANYSPSRPFKGALELALGYSVNRNNDLVNPDTRTPTSFVARLLGSKTAREARVANAQYQNASERMSKQATMDALNYELVTALRSIDNKDMKAVEALKQEYLARYIAQGKNPDYFKSWFGEKVKKAYVPKYEQEISELVGKDERTSEYIRLLAGMGNYATNEEEEQVNDETINEMKSTDTIDTRTMIQTANQIKP